MSENPLDEVALAQLATARAHPHDPSAELGVEWIQTHLSHVFLTRDRVYKFRKDVSPGFVDFHARGERNRDCLREVLLNRRLAPDVYLGVAPLLGHGPDVRVGEVSESLHDDVDALEHCVVMRRLPEGRDALSLLSRGDLGSEQIDRVATVLAGFHAKHGLGVPTPLSAEQWYERCTGAARDTWAVLDGSGLPADVELLTRSRAQSDAFASSHTERFEARRIAGRGVDGHGDLHLQHVWFEDADASPVMIDCLEFSESLRCIDRAAEVAFLAMDLGYRGEEKLAERFLGSYARAGDDFGLYGLVDFYRSYRAAVRAKVAALASSDSSIPDAQRADARESVARHLEYATACLRARRPGPLVLVVGSVGVGKSTVAEQLADLLPGVVIASDFVRKHRRGLAPSDRVDDPQALYSETERGEVYRALLSRAECVAGSGRGAILDATFSRASDRQAARQAATRLGTAVVAIEVGCEDAVARARVTRRAAQGTDASDAGPELQRTSAASFESLDDWPREAHFRVRTDHENWRNELVGVAEAIRRQALR